MKKIFLLLLTLVLLVSCSQTQHTFVENDDGTLTMDGETYYPLSHSYRFTDYGKGKKQGAILGADIYIPHGEDTVLLAQSESSYTYYVPETLRDLDKPLEDCEAFFFVPVSHLNKEGRIDRKYIEDAKVLTGKDAEDFSFYVFYGRAPSEYGYSNGRYVGEVYATFPETDTLVSAYSVYKYDELTYGIVIDGDEYMLDPDQAKKIGIITGIVK